MRTTGILVLIFTVGTVATAYAKKKSWYDLARRLPAFAGAAVGAWDSEMYWGPLETLAVASASVGLENISLHFVAGGSLLGDQSVFGVIALVLAAYEAVVAYKRET
jgi:hypothetical protein